MKNKTTISKTIAKFAFFAMCSFPLMGTFQGKAQIINPIAGTGSAGYSGDGGAATAAAITNPFGGAVDASGNIYISDATNSVIRRISTSGVITTIAGTGTSGYNGDGIAATAAQLYAPKGITFDASGNMYIADQLNQRIRMIDPSGTIYTYAGSGYQGFFGDGGPAIYAGLSYPTGVAYDNSTGSLYIADALNSRVRKVDAGGNINTVGGFAICIGVCIGGGDLYVTEWYSHRVAKMNLTTGAITYVAGIIMTPGYSGNGGPATNAKLNGPSGIAYDASGNLFISDGGNRVIRKVTPSGIISTYAGTGSTTYNGDGISAVTAAMVGDDIALDAAGNLLVCDPTNSRLRIISTHTPYFLDGASSNVALCQDYVNYPMSPYFRIKDIDAGQTLTISVVSGPSHGTAALSYSVTSTGGAITPTGLTYTPTTGYSGSDAVTVMVSDGNSFAYRTINFTINPKPSAPIISGDSIICARATTTLTATPSGGYWGSMDGNTSTGATTGIVTARGTGASTIYYNSPYNSYGCRTQSRRTIYILDIPSAGRISGVSSICPGSSSTFSGSVSGGAWTSSNTSVATTTVGGSVTGVTSGVVNISYTVSNACFSSTATRALTVSGATTLPAIDGYPYLRPGMTSPLTNAVAGGTWSSSNTSVAIVSGGGTAVGVSPGVDTIYYSYTNGCGITSSVMKRITVLAFRDENSNTLEEASSVELSLYPNPASGVVTLELQGATGNTDVAVFDIAGKLTYSATSEATKISLDLSALATGTYLVKATNNAQVYTKKIIVQ